MHSRYSDGKGELRDFVQSAIKSGFTTIGLSDHSPVPLDNCWSMKIDKLQAYINEVKKLKRDYQNDFELLLGVELDYIDGINVKEYIDFGSCDFDYFIGSVHYIYSKILGQYLTVDDSEDEFKYLLSKGFDNSAQDLVHAYYSSLRKMVKAYNPKVIGHIDLIKKNNGQNKYFNEQDYYYIREVEMTLDVIKKHGAFIEINTGAISRGYTDVPYPSGFILRRCLEKGIGVTLNSDAHEPLNIGYKFDNMIEMLKEIGFGEIHFLHGGKWTAFLL